MVTAAVTGSSGKLGRHVVRELHEHGYRVVALDRVPDPQARPMPAFGWS
jgi:UDP-glucose 4-epimerase